MIIKNLILSALASMFLTGCATRGEVEQLSQSFAESSYRINMLENRNREHQAVIAEQKRQHQIDAQLLEEASKEAAAANRRADEANEKLEALRNEITIKTDGMTLTPLIPESAEISYQ